MWNDKETDVDLLGHDKIAQTIIEIINDNHLRPLTIGVYGDWGVGKSSILSLLQMKINEEKDLKVSNSHCVLFNGWLFQDYEDAKTALMETVVVELAKLQPKSKQIQKLAKSLFRRIKWLKVAKVSSSAATTLLTGIPTPGILGGLGDLYKQGKKLINGKSEVGEEDDSGSSTDEESFLKEVEEETVTQQVHAFRAEFKKLIETSRVDHIIILVDDLDRCLPKAVIEVLEAIRLLLFVEGTTFVLSADEKMIEYAVREHFPNLPASYQDYTKNYLEKLIQIPIRIPLLNKAQTGNYIKLLMLQNHLKHDYERLKEVYTFYEKKKKKPYEAVNLSYEIISQAISSDTVELKETLLVADQLTPTLATGLKGNPRNIKRFMNTLFLRMKVARIYGLDDVVKLNMLGKLMLLERFQTKFYEEVADEVASSDNGISKTIKEGEKKLNEAKKREESSPDAASSESSLKFIDWLSIEPSMTDVDLRPYIFVSKEKAIGFEAESLFPEHLQNLLQLLNTGSDFNLKKAESGLRDLKQAERMQLFEKLLADTASVPDLKNVPVSIKGLLRIIQVDTSLEVKLVELMDRYPHTELGVWAISQFSGLKEDNSKHKFNQLLQKWSNQDQNKQLRDLAKQTLKK